MKEPGAFCEMYGADSRTKVLEYVLCSVDIDFAVSGILDLVDISKPKAYEVIYEFEKKDFIKKSRKIGKTQLYRVNKDNPRIKLYIKQFNECLKLVLNEMQKQELITQRTRIKKKTITFYL